MKITAQKAAKMIKKINVSSGFSQFNETWTPYIAGDVNHTQIKLAKFEGEFTWHSHDTEDEMFFVITGRLRMKIRNQEDLILNSGEFVVVPHGIEHKPIAEIPCEVILLEPNSTLNTGNATDSRTVRDLKKIKPV